MSQSIEIHLFQSGVKTVSVKDKWQLEIDGSLVPLTVRIQDEGFILTNESLDMSHLVQKKLQVRLIQNGSTFKFTDFSDSKPRSEFSIEVVQ